MTLARLLHAREGVSTIEFAMLAPVFCLFLVGAFDVTHTLYMRVAIEGVVQKTARDASLEESVDAASQNDLDAKVAAQVKLLAKTATITSTRRFYRTFSDAAAAKAEPWTDTNGNGTCDPPIGLTPGEPFTDVNNNSVWDKDGGNAGQGGARDKTVYTVTVKYQRLLPLYRFIDVPREVTEVASTVLANQPYTDQGSYAAPTQRNCK